MNDRSRKIGLNKRAAGFSLVEIMVALLISLFILGGAITILVQNQQNYRQNDDFGRLQENARFALDLITSDLRMAGFWGCSINLRNQIAGVVAGSGSLLDTTFALDGFEQDTGAWDAQGSVEVVNDIVAGTDAITVRKLRNTGVPVSASITASGSIIVQNNASPVGNGELAAIYNCNSTDLFQVSGVTATTIDHAMGPNIGNNFSTDYPQNAAHSANPAGDPDGLSAQTFVAPFDAVRYYIAANDDGEPSLWRQYHDGANIVQQPVVEGVENMQILYGENTVPGGEPNTFVNADMVTDWNRVAAVRVTLLIRSIDEHGAEQDTKTYDINGTPDNTADDMAAPMDRRIRRLVSATVLLRNLQTKIGT